MIWQARFFSVSNKRMQNYSGLCYKQGKVPFVKSG